MTKVECPGPGFKGLKWKWIQDHAKEQQEREKELIPTQPVQLPGATQPHSQQQQRPAPNSSAEPSQPAGPVERHARASRHSGGGCGPPQPAPGNAVQSQPSVKIEPANGFAGTGPARRASLAGDALNASSEERGRVKEEQETKAARTELLNASATHTAPGGGLEVGGISLSPSTAPAAAGAAAGPSGAASASAAVSAGVSLTGSGVSPTPTMPAAAGLLVRKSMDVTASIPASSVSLSPVAVASPSAIPTGKVEPTHGAAATAAIAVGQVVAAAATPSCILTPPSAPAPVTMPYSAAVPQASTAPAVQPSGAVQGPLAQPLASGAATRVRLPPARGASLTVAKTKGGDDFESMFTPLSSLPTAKSETPRAGLISRSSSLLPGPQTSLPNAAAGGSAPGATTAAPHDAGGGLSQGVERKGQPKKAARLQDCRSTAGQPSASAAAASEPLDGDHGPSARSRTPVAQVSPVAAAPAGAAKDAAAGATTCTAAPAPGKAQPQCQTAPQVHGPSQPAQQPPQQQQPPQSQQQQQQQRAPGVKHAKDGPRLRESGEGAVLAATTTAGTGAAPVAGVVGLLTAAGRGGAGGDRAGAPASAGSTPAAAPTHSGGEAKERKRPRSEGSKPKAGASLSGDPFADTGWPYGETLADRIKRAKRATTSSSDHEGPHSHGGSAERPTGHAAANAGNPAACEDGPGNAAGAAGPCSGARGADEPPPRPTVSAEAQSRGAEAAAPGIDPTRGSRATVSGAAAAAGASAKQQQQRHQPPAQGRGQSFGRSDEPPLIALALFPRSGDKSLEQAAQNPASINLRTSGGGAVTDSSGGGGGPSGPQRVSGPSTSGKAVAGASGAAASAGGKRAAAEAPPSARRHTVPLAKYPRSDPHLPRPHQPHGQDRREAAAAVAAGSGRGGSTLPPPPASKLSHRASSGAPTGRTDDGPGPNDGQGPPTSGTAPGQAPAPAGPPLAPPTGRLGRIGESDMPAAGSCKGPVVVGSRSSKDGACDKGACGPRHAGGVLDAVCGGGGGTGGYGAGAAATTTTEPKTDSDTRTSRVVECFFEFDHPCRAAGGSASISGMVSSGSLQAGHGLGMRLGGSRFFGGGPPAAALPTRGGAGGGGGGSGATAAAQLLDLGKIRSFKELWTQLAALFDGILPDEMDSKLIYLDEEGDWIMVTPDEPWSSMAAAATKVLVTNRT